MLFKASGAGFAGPVDEQHEGFAMWNSRVNPHTGAAMGLKCGVVGELTKAIRGQGTKFMTAMYHGISICTKRGNPANAFYGEPHNTDWDEPENEIDPNPCVANHRVFSHAWIDRARRLRTAGRKNSRKSWLNAARSDVGRFRFEIHSRWLQARLSGLLLQQNRDLCATYKWHNMVVGRNVENPEQGKRGDLTYNFWVTDMSKNSVLILNVSPKADGTIPEKAQHILLGMGRSLALGQR